MTSFDTTLKRAGAAAGSYIHPDAFRHYLGGSRFSIFPFCDGRSLSVGARTQNRARCSALENLPLYNRTRFLSRFLCSLCSSDPAVHHQHVTVVGNMAGCTPWLLPSLSDAGTFSRFLAGVASVWNQDILFSAPPVGGYFTNHSML